MVRDFHDILSSLISEKEEKTLIWVIKLLMNDIMVNILYTDQIQMDEEIVHQVVSAYVTSSGKTWLMQKQIMFT